VPIAPPVALALAIAEPHQGRQHRAARTSRRRIVDKKRPDRLEKAIRPRVKINIADSAY
jgi:hypothetical protein